MTLKRFGWNAYFEAIWNQTARGSSVPARVTGQHRRFWDVAGDFGEARAEVSGRVRLAAEEGALWPAVGDWVVVSMPEKYGNAVIEEVLPRRSQFVRKAAGTEVREQVIAGNMDTALLVNALDGDYSPRRIERYVAQCWESGARPVVVLNKADQCADAAERAAKIERIAIGVPVVTCSAKTGQGMSAFEEFVRPGDTLVLLGSSGVGKSTLVNHFLGKPVQEVQATRASDSKGRHTTTSRTLFCLPNGAMIIDTPGLRELQLWNAAEGMARAFADIEELAAKCRFRDCKHETEPGCAVQAAFTDGSLDPERADNRRKLQREQEFLLRKIDPEARQEQKLRWKRIHRQAREKYRQREADGGKR